ncbi:PREDICTED: putative F-box/LRR-repeat protein 23 [Fragaria vesca subsp. vesca]|uniref:putative F-box/LRR-repeat protein 23 n=1 Tax=Fragaria vesca subsp. vesca TaxID=101020 RepID=UPI0002C2E3EC|nr:PREDICTED: putative F-box/LRR-repeat protein 23 [Fragaria vesca subsp. vesca]XP_011470184.1 PREDICTED: putative F-box/LRR-repeat protein 23 [Fragaria vesca subsp. vesca]
MAEPSNKTQRQDWIDLPEEITASILSRLGAIEILVTAVYVCTTWRRICMDPRNWLTIDMRDDSLYGKSSSSRYQMDMLCRKAVDLSCGNLVGISVHNFGSDDLLKHITDSCRGIKRLCFVLSNITTNGLIEAAPKLPLLEELELSHCNYRLDIPPFEHTRHANVEVIGRCCPRLKSLKLNKYNTKWFFLGWDGDAHAVAETMHGLHHLQLFGNKLTSKDLRAILDGCPLLETLDLRHCWHINLGRDRSGHFGLELDEELKTRCLDGIKNLRLPHDSKHDYERLAARKFVDNEFVEESMDWEF